MGSRSMRQSFEGAAQAILGDLDGDEQRFAEAAGVHFEGAYERTFGMGERVARRREELGFTQAQLAERSGVRQSDISRIERGKANPTQATLERIAAALKSRIVLEALHGAG